MLLGTKLRVFPIILTGMRLASVHMGSTKRMLRFEEVWEEIDYGRSYNHLNGKFLLKRDISLLTAYSNFIKSWFDRPRSAGAHRGATQQNSGCWFDI